MQWVQAGFLKVADSLQNSLAVLFRGGGEIKEETSERFSKDGSYEQRTGIHLSLAFTRYQKDLMFLKILRYRDESFQMKKRKKTNCNNTGKKLKHTSLIASHMISFPLKPLTSTDPRNLKSMKTRNIKFLPEKCSIDVYIDFINLITQYILQLRKKL